MFQGQGQREIMERNKKCEIDFGDQRYNDIGSDALNLLTKMLEKDPNVRPSAQ